MGVSSVLLYDGDCAFCSRCVDWGFSQLNAFPTALTSQSQSDEQLRQLGLSRPQVTERVYLVLPDGRSFGGASAVAQLLRLQTAWWWVAIGTALTLPGIRSLAEFAYKLVASNRHRMPGASESCELP